MVLQNLYSVAKIESEKLIQNKLNIQNYTLQEAKLNDEIVSIGDNLVFHKIREYYNQCEDHIENFNKIQSLRKELKKIKKQPFSKINSIKIKEINEKLNSILYIKDIINVKVVHKKDYKLIGKKGFYVNGKHYVRFCCGAGQMRRNTVTFINEEIYDYVNECLMCGLKNKIEEINLAKYSAYFALSFSSVYWVRKPNVCIIDDFFTTAKNENIDYIYTDIDGVDKVKKQIMDVKQNSADGQGLIDPQFAQLWSEDMRLDFTPCSFVCRSSFVKGQLVTFDFKDLAKKNNIKYIKDIYGVEYDIDNIDVLLSKSQFKMWKKYTSWQEYTYYHNKYNLKWGVARYNKKNDDEYTLANYQYVQNLNLTKEDIKEMIQPTVNWINKICNGDLLYALLYTLGVRRTSTNINQILNETDSLFGKAIVNNNDFLKDGYIQKKIYDCIKESIKQSKIGRIWLKGNYSFMISDPYAQAQFALGLNPTGLLKYGNAYSNFWNKYNPYEIDLCRSPMVDFHEHNILKLQNSEEINYWYKYIYSGIIYNIYDLSCIRHSDSDFDGDIVFSTNNKQFLKGAYRDTNPITYEKELAPSQKFNKENIIKCDLIGFDTKVGTYSNNSTKFFSMLSLFDKPQYKEQYDEIKNRLKLQRKFIGSEIDKIKGCTPPNLPKSWTKKQKIEKDDSDEIKSEKYKWNSMVLDKKPYFFIYLYYSLYVEYKEIIKIQNINCRRKFQYKLNNLYKKKNKSKEEINYLQFCNRQLNVLKTDCVMNLLCKEIENTDFNILYEKEKCSMLYEFVSEDFIPNSEIATKILEVYKKYYIKIKNKDRDIFLNYAKDFLSKNDVKDLYLSKQDNIMAIAKEKLYEIVSNSQDLFNYLLYISNVQNFQYSFIWNILGEDILDIIRKDETLIPTIDKNGEEYLGNKYSLTSIKMK